MNNNDENNDEQNNKNDLRSNVNMINENQKKLNQYCHLDSSQSDG